jgi:hypothetical protein
MSSSPGSYRPVACSQSPNVGEIRRSLLRFGDPRQTLRHRFEPWFLSVAPKTLHCEQPIPVPLVHDHVAGDRVPQHAVGMRVVCVLAVAAILQVNDQVRSGARRRFVERFDAEVERHHSFPDRDVHSWNPECSLNACQITSLDTNGVALCAYIIGRREQLRVTVPDQSYEGKWSLDHAGGLLRFAVENASPGSVIHGLAVKHFNELEGRSPQ